jgi:hypothetical protein
VQRAKKVRDSPPDPKESTFDIRARLREKLKYKFQPHEYAILFGLLIAWMLQPRKQRLSTHSFTTFIGALAAGEFGKWMSRQRYEVWILDIRCPVDHVLLAATLSRQQNRERPS